MEIINIYEQFIFKNIYQFETFQSETKTKLISDYIKYSYK